MIPSFDDVKKIAKVLQEAGKIDLYEKVLEMQQQLLEMQDKIGSLTAENKKMKETKDISKKLKLIENLYWIIDGDEKEGPFCPRCWHKENILMPMPVYPNQFCFTCPNCKTQINNQHHISPRFQQSPFEENF